MTPRLQQQTLSLLLGFAGYPVFRWALGSVSDFSHQPHRVSTAVPIAHPKTELVGTGTETSRLRVTLLAGIWLTADSDFPPIAQASHKPPGTIQIPWLPESEC